MPLLAILALILAVILATIALMPLALLQRYRAGTARRAARRWVATLNLVSLTATAALFVVGAAVTSIWVAGTLRFTLLGLAAGSALGALGLGLTRWERTPRFLYYTPNKLLVLGITLLVTGRLAYGFWRAWHVWSSGADRAVVLASAGIPLSMAAGAVVLGYYLTFWIGVRRRANA